MSPLQQPDTIKYKMNIFHPGYYNHNIQSNEYIAIPPIKQLNTLSYNTILTLVNISNALIIMVMIYKHINIKQRNEI